MSGKHRGGRLKKEQIKSRRSKGRSGKVRANGDRSTRRSSASSRGSYGTPNSTGISPGGKRKKGKRKGR